jgi:hypothetical protein
MGWTSYHASHYKNGKVDRIAEVKDYLGGTDAKDNLSVLAISQRGSVVYAAVKDNIRDVVFAAVILTSINMKDYYNFSYKSMEESSGPAEANCPQKILNLLSPTDNEFAIHWRKRCRENIEKAKEKKTNPLSLKNLPINSVISMPYWKGGTKTLKKIVWGFEGKTIWTDGQYRYKEKDIEHQGYTVLQNN